MMEILTEYSLYTLLFSNAVLVCGAALAVSRFERRIRNNREFWDSPTGVAMIAPETHGSIAPATPENSGAVLSGFLERRLAIMHQRLNEMDAKLDEGVGLPQVNPLVDPSFAHAARMAKNGAGTDDLMRTCGLTQAEAGLVRKLHTQVETGSDAA